MTLAKLIEIDRKMLLEIKRKRRKRTSANNTIETKIKQHMKTIDDTRRTRIQFSKRLSSYSRKWRFIFFVINIEAVIFVLLSLMEKIDTITFGNFNMSFSLLSGIFTIYVILLQYYINVMNYNERALQVHYHQLELQDLKLQLEMLFVKVNTNEIEMTEKMMIDQFNDIVAKYQLVLKNNENHRDLDYKQMLYRTALYNYKRGKTNKKPKEEDEPKDLTTERLLIGANIGLTVIMFIVLSVAVLFFSG